MREQHAVALVHVELQQPTELQQQVVGEVGATRDHVVERHGAREALQVCISCESAAELRLLGELISLKVNDRGE